MTGATKDVMNGFKWELYDLNKDWTQSKDLASQMPDKLRDLQQTFTAQDRREIFTRSRKVRVERQRRLVHY